VGAVLDSEGVKSETSVGSMLDSQGVKLQVRDGGQDEPNVWGPATRLSQT